MHMSDHERVEIELSSLLFRSKFPIWKQIAYSTWKYIARVSVVYAYACCIYVRVLCIAYACGILRIPFVYCTCLLSRYMSVFVYAYACYLCVFMLSGRMHVVNGYVSYLGVSHLSRSMKVVYACACWLWICMLFKGVSAFWVYIIYE